MQPRIYFRTIQCATFSFFQPVLFLLFILFSLFFLSGCMSYKKCPHHFISEHPTPKETSTEHKTLSHPIYRIVPRHRSQIYWYDLPHWTTWMLFGNDNDGIFGESQKHPYCPTQKNNLGKAIRWWIRNPLHNFTFYTIGNGDKPNNEFIFLRFNRNEFEFMRYHRKSRYNFGGKKGSFLLALHGGLPFIAFRLPNPLKVEGYFGWRKGGHFGMCLRRGHYKNDKVAEIPNHQKQNQNQETLKTQNETQNHRQDETQDQIIF